MQGASPEMLSTNCVNADATEIAGPRPGWEDRIQELGLPETSRKLYACLAEHHLGGGVTTTTEAAIAEACGVSTRTVRRRLRDLAERGLVVVGASRVPRQGHARAHRGANAYVVHDPAAPYQPAHRPAVEASLRALGRRVGVTYSIRALTGQEDNGFVRPSVRPIFGDPDPEMGKEDKQWGGHLVRPRGDQGNRDGDAAIAIAGAGAGEGTGATAPGAETGEPLPELSLSLAEYACQCCREEMGCEMRPYLLGPWLDRLTPEAIAATAARCGARKRQGEAGAGIRVAYPGAYYLVALQEAAGVRPRRGRDATPTVVPLRRESAAPAHAEAPAAPAEVDMPPTAPTVPTAVAALEDAVALADLPVDLPAPAARAKAPVPVPAVSPAAPAPTPAADRRAASAAVAEASPAQPRCRVGVSGMAGPDAGVVAAVTTMGEALRREPVAAPDLPAERVEVPVPSDAEMLRQMLEIGITESVARDRISRVPAEVARQLAWRQHRQHARNPAGMLLAAIDGRWEEPAGAREARLRAAERDAQVRAQEEQDQVRERAQSPEGRAAALAWLATCRATMGMAPRAG